MRGHEGQSWTTQFGGNYQMIPRERYEALLATEAKYAQAAPVLAAAHGLAEDSEAYARGALTLEVWESARRTGVGRIVAAVRAAREGGG